MSTPGRVDAGPPADAQPAAEAPGGEPPSPCIGVCRMDEPTGWCAGCLRTLDEIGAWPWLDGAGKRELLLELRQRRLQWRQRLRPEAGAAESP